MMEIMAAKYRKVDPRIWSDEKFVTLDTGDKLLAIYVITAQSNRIGIFKFSPALAAEDLQLSKSCATRVRHICDTFSWRWDDTCRVIYLPTWWKYNRPENKSHFIGCLKDIHDIPQTYLIIEFLENTKYLPEGYHELLVQLLDTCGTAVPTGHAQQEQEQEQEQEQINSSDKPTQSESNDVRQVFDHWVATFGTGKGRAPILDQKRKGKIRARIKEGFTVDQLKKAISGASKSDYHVTNGYTGLVTILKSAETVEGHIARLNMNGIGSACTQPGPPPDIKRLDGGI